MVAGHDGRQAWFGRKCSYLPGPKAIMDHGSWIMEYGVWSMEYGAWSMDVEDELEAKTAAESN